MVQFLHFRILEFPLTAGRFRMKHPNQRMDDLGPMTSESSKVAPVGSGLRGSRFKPHCVFTHWGNYPAIPAITVWVPFGYHGFDPQFEPWSSYISYISYITLNRDYFRDLVPGSSKQDAAHEPECSQVCQWHRCRNTWIWSHAEHFPAIVYLNSLVHISLVTSLQCGVESVECGVWSGKCRVWGVKCGV